MERLKNKEGRRLMTDFTRRSAKILRGQSGTPQSTNVGLLDSKPPRVAASQCTAKPLSALSGVASRRECTPCPRFRVVHVEPLPALDYRVTVQFRSCEKRMCVLSYFLSLGGGVIT